jgi:hypothetical protein
VRLWRFELGNFIQFAVQVDGEATSLSYLAFHLHAAPVEIGQSLDERQAESSALMLAVQTAIDLHKRLE